MPVNETKITITANWFIIGIVLLSIFFFCFTLSYIIDYKKQSKINSTFKTFKRTFCYILFLCAIIFIILGETLPNKTLSIITTPLSIIGCILILINIPKKIS